MTGARPRGWAGALGERRGPAHPLQCSPGPGLNRSPPRILPAAVQQALQRTEASGSARERGSAADTTHTDTQTHGHTHPTDTPQTHVRGGAVKEAQEPTQTSQWPKLTQFEPQNTVRNFTQSVTKIHKFPLVETSEHTHRGEEETNVSAEESNAPHGCPPGRGTVPTPRAWAAW